MNQCLFQFESLQSASATLNATVGKKDQLYESQFESLALQIKEIQKRLDETVAASVKIVSFLLLSFRPNEHFLGL